MTDPAAPTPTGSVAAWLAVPGLDLPAARAVVHSRAWRRTRFRRGAVGLCAVVVLVAAVVLTLDPDDPHDVIADADTPTSTLTTTGAVVGSAAAPGVAPVAPDAAATPPAAPTGTAALALSAPGAAVAVPRNDPFAPQAVGTAPPANQSMDATLKVLTPVVSAGGTVEVQLDWADRDLADPTGVRVVSFWGDPAVALPVPEDGAAPCDVPGPGGSGSVPLRFRYATPGSYQVTVHASSCGGLGAYGEGRVLTALVTVTAPPAGMRALVLTGNSGGWGMDAATAMFDPVGTPPRIPVGVRDPELGQVPVAPMPGAATVVLVPVGVGGQIVLARADGACLAGTVPEAAPSGSIVEMGPSGVCSSV